MKIKFALNAALIAAAGLFAVPGFAGNGGEIIYKTDSLFRAAEFSAIASGKNFGGASHAVSRREFAYRTLRQDTEPVSDGFKGNLGLTLSPFVGWYKSPYSGDDEITPTALIYLYKDMPSAVSFSAGAGVDDFFYAKLVYNASCSKKSVADGYGTLHPISGEFYDSGDSPNEGYMSFAGKHMAAVIGRLPGGIGHGIVGNLFQNSRATYYDQISFSFFNRFVKYSYMLGWSSYHLTGAEEKYLNGVDGNNDGVIDPSEPTDILPAINYNYSPVKMFSFHRLEFAFTDTFTVGIGEMTLVGGKFPDFNMINPFGIFHNIYESTYHSYYAAIDVSWVPARNHFIFAEVLANEIYAPGESNTDPTAMGYQLGYWFILPTSTKTKHRIAIELAHLDGWTYSDLTPYLTMYQRQIQREITFDIPLGYAYGGDCQSASLIYTAVAADGIQLDVTAMYMQKGEIGLELENADTADARMPYTRRNKYKGMPSGTVEHWFAGKADLDLPLIKSRLNLNILAYYAYIANFEHKKGNQAHLAFISAGVTFTAF